MADRPRTPISRFDGHIVGAGTASGTRMVLGAWHTSPFGPFAGVQVEHGNGHRILLASRPDVADFIAHTYSFDEVLLTEVNLMRDGVGPGSHWHVHAGPLTWHFTVGSRTGVGALLRLMPAALFRQEWAARLAVPVAGVLVPGVRTWGTAGHGRTEWYAASDMHQLVHSSVTWEGTDLGEMREVSPAPKFGFSSTPARPGVTVVTSQVR